MMKLWEFDNGDGERWHRSGDDHDGMRWVWLMMIKYYGNDPVNSRTETG